MSIRNSRERSASQKNRQKQYGEMVKNLFPSTPKNTDKELPSSVKKTGQNSGKSKPSIPPVFFRISSSSPIPLTIPKDTPIKSSDNLSRGERLIYKLKALNSSIAMVCVIKNFLLFCRKSII
jgi:hypothetical protein